MRPSLLLQLVTLGMLVMPGLSFSADPPASASAPAAVPAPPKMEKLDEGSDPGVNIKQPTERNITEKRSNGKVTEVKVKSGKSTYYMRPNDPKGSALRGDRGTNEVRGAQWQVMEFDLGQKKNSKEEKDGKAADPAPPAPAAASSAPPVKK